MSTNERPWDLVIFPERGSCRRGRIGKLAGCEKLKGKLNSEVETVSILTPKTLVFLLGDSGWGLDFFFTPASLSPGSRAERL